MKKLAWLLVFMVLANVLVGCTSPASSSTPPAGDSSTAISTPDVSGGGSSTAPVGPPEMHEVYSLISETIAFDGLRPSYYDSRADIPKGLPKESDGDVYVGFPISRMSSQSFVDLTDGVKERCDLYGYRFEFTDAAGSLEKQRADFEAFITKGVDAIIINPIEPAANELDVAKAVEQGVIVVGCGISFFPSAGVLTCVWTNNYGQGWALGVETAGMFPADEPLNIGMILGRFGQSMNESKANGLVGGMIYKRAEMMGKPFATQEDAMLEGYNLFTEFRDVGSKDIPDYNINLLGAGEGQLTANIAMQVADNLITAYPEMNLMYIDTDEMGEGVVQTLIASNVDYGNDGQLKLIFGGSANEFSMGMIRDETLLATAHGNPYQNSYVMVDLIHAVLEEDFDASNLTISTYAETVIVTLDNVDEWQVEGEWYPKPIEYMPVSIDEWNSAHAA